MIGYIISGIGLILSVFTLGYSIGNYVALKGFYGK